MDPSQSQIDELTGALTRRWFCERIDEAIAAARQKETCFALCMADIDRCKVINDTYGHNAGDIVLRDVAARLRNVIWADDVLGRFGGDEFAVLLAGADRERSRRAVEKMRKAVRQPMNVGDATVTPDVSIGIALYPDEGLDLEGLLRRADQDAQRVKRDRRNST